MGDDLFIGEIGARFDVIVPGLRFPLHEGVQHCGQRGFVQWNGALAEHVPCDCHKAVGGAGEIDFQTEGTVVDVVRGFVVDKFGVSTEEAPQSGTGGGAFKIGGIEDAQDGGGNVIQAAVFPDTVVDVDGTDAVGYPEADSVVTAQRIGAHGCGKRLEGGRIVGSGHLICAGDIGDLRRLLLAFALYIPPCTEAGVLLQFCRDVYEIDLSGAACSVGGQVFFIHVLFLLAGKLLPRCSGRS